MDEYDEPVEWRFTPSVPVREDVLGEGVFLEQWRKTAMQPGGAFEEKKNEPGTYRIDRSDIDFYNDRFALFNMFGFAPNKRDSILVADFMKWLGMNAGVAFRNEAQRLRAEKPFETETAHIKIWAQENIPKFWLNHGATPRSLLLRSFYDASQYPEAIYDVEVLERAALWLDTKRGQAYLKTCDDILTQRYHERNEARRTHKPDIR